MKTMMTTARLKKAVKSNPEGVLRLAKFLKLSITGMSVGQVSRLIRWRLTRNDMVKLDAFQNHVVNY